MNSPKLLYILISVFCVFAIIAGIYAQSIEGRKTTPSFNRIEEKENTLEEKTAAMIKEEFDDLFTGVLNLNGYDTTGIPKMNSDKEIVYTAFDIQEETDAYDINIKVPAFNIANEVASSFNSITQAKFLNKVGDIREKTDNNSKTIYSIEYAGFVNGNILSVIIRSTLKEGNSAQRVMVQTYNYNLETSQKVSLTDLITLKALNKDDVSKKIKQVVKEADEEMKAVQNMGYNEVFSRDLASSMYQLENSGVYFFGPNNNLYIVYPYGNQNFTSQMDIVLFE